MSDKQEEGLNWALKLTVATNQPAKKKEWNMVATCQAGGRKPETVEKLL